MMERVTKHDIDLGFYVDENGYREERWKSNITGYEIDVIQGDAVNRLGELEDAIEEEKFVEVVRCKYCKHWDEHIKFLNSRSCSFWSSDSRHIRYTMPDDYCRQGEWNRRAE